ncbi:hypothetical protein Dsin_008885 [Dipteronia sinensis]|uniref:Uncharacterized protein n=1 Tax=Dipteronia sinensis TaxID=43782 RepID=A0AAE0ECZ0_9ROSI|nr:hypothetical protein Dsin_008885 [Dipteronia sinensis]
MEMPKKVVGSFVWHSLVWGTRILDLGTRRRGGASIRIFKDNWVPGSASLGILSHPNLSLDATVDCLLTDSRGWNLQKLNLNFPADEVDSIVQIPVGLGSVEDTNI